MKTIAFVPIDNRPVTFLLPKQICAIDKDLKLLSPKREWMGDLKRQAKVEQILSWLDDLGKIDILILSLDTIAYGGLIPSRFCPDNKDIVLKRINKLKSIIEKKGAKTFAFSSIMRISNNNCNDEEKEYWSNFGKRIFEYSYACHKTEKTLLKEDEQLCICSKSKIPEDILSDYIDTRKRNFEINREYIQWIKDKILDALVFSKDDCAKYGFNVKEAEELEILSKNLTNVFIKTGADEIPVSLLARAILTDSQKQVKIKPVFLYEQGKDLISNYEDISVQTSVCSQLELSGAEVVEENEDLTLIVNNFPDKQGELMLDFESVKNETSNFVKPQGKYFVADIKNANGGDNCFVETLLKQIEIDKFYGYAGWNTTGNTLGTTVACALVRFLAKNPDEDKFKELQLIRFLDDWGYQANVRNQLKQKQPAIAREELKNYMRVYEKKLEKVFEVQGLEEKINYLLPWNRMFEIEISLKNWTE